MSKKDPVKSAIKADAKTWPLAILLIALYLMIGSKAHGTNEAFADTMEESYFQASGGEPLYSVPK